jgi:hypothetical protein
MVRRASAMGRAGVGSGRRQARYRGIEHIDASDLRERVSAWLDEHPDATDEQ